MIKKNLFKFLIVEDSSIDKALRQAIERSAAALKAKAEYKNSEVNTEFGVFTLPAPKKPLFSFGEKALSNIANAISRSPTVH